jgi:hypothetical protein
MWTTIRVWKNTAAPTDPQGPLLTLVTTSTAAAGSAAVALRNDDARDVSVAIERLRAAAAASTNKETSDVREWFAALTPADAEVFVSRITIADAATPIENVDEAVRAALWWATPPGQEETFVALLWRWWDGVALDMLQGRRGPVSVPEGRASIAHIRDKFSDDNLPTLIDLADVDEATLVAAHDSRLFVEQMRWVDYALPNLRRAIVDYHRAVTQTTEWLDRDLIGLAELSTFEDRLRDEWGRAFDDMVDDLGEDADDATKAAAGKVLLRMLLDSTRVNVRARYNDPFFARGKRHELADGGRFGWHPEFTARVEQLLASPT